MPAFGRACRSRSSGRRSQPHEKVVVHGHTIVETPEVCHNRIGIDTGAYVSDVLTCLCLEGRDYRFLAS